FLLSFVMQALALGTLFAVHGWWRKRSRIACFFTGAACTPMAQYLWTLALAVLWPHAPRLLYIGGPPVLAGAYLLGVLWRRRKALRSLPARGWALIRRLCTFDKPALISLCFTLAMALLLLPVCVRLCGSMNAANPGDSGEYMALAQRYCEDRDFGKLLEKDERDGFFRGNSHFPSLEVYMAYCLMHTPADYGYPYDKPLLFGLGLLSFAMAAAFASLLAVLCRERKRWVLLGALLLNLAPNLFFSVQAAPRDTWRILALLLAALYFAGLQPLRPGGWKTYVLKLLAAFAVCFTVMSTHVVCFVVLPFLVAAWALTRWYDALSGGKKRAGRELRAAVGIAFSGGLGTLAAFAGNLWCFAKWGEMSPWRLMTTYTAAPWYNLYMAGEYKLEETTTQLNFWQAKYDIVMAYATPIGLWGMRLAVAGLLAALIYLVWRRRSKTRVPQPNGTLKHPGSENGQRIAGNLCFASLLTLCTLAPMTGLLDSGLYSFSGAFIALQRYTLQWFVFAGAMIPAALAALEESWPIFCAWFHLKADRLRTRRSPRPAARRLLQGRGWREFPAWLCAGLCVLAFFQGVDQTGYSNSFYRYSRNVMEDKSALLDNGFLERYGLLMLAGRLVPADQKILITRTGYQYPLRARGYVLTSNPIVPLMNLQAKEVPSALREMNVAMLATEPEFWDERYYAASALHEALSALPREQILQDEYMRLYILDAGLADAIRSVWRSGLS
ncbi:MAG: hypothetical protein FWF86_03900, partial [Clostridia bacterium]|nr:hypothetical protein [Clostridia bacterium]